MGLNFYCVCHACKLRRFLFRGEESAAMHEFYGQHATHRWRGVQACEVQGDGETEQDWMSSKEYRDDARDPRGVG